MSDSTSTNWDDIDRALPTPSATAWDALSHDRALPRLESQLGAVPEALKRYLDHKKMTQQYYSELPSWQQVTLQRQAHLWYTTGVEQ